MKQLFLICIISGFVFLSACKDLFHNRPEWEDELPAVPAIDYHFPAQNMDKVAIKSAILISFSKELDESTVNDNTIIILDNSNNKIAGQLRIYNKHVVLFYGIN